MVRSRGYTYIYTGDVWHPPMHRCPGCSVGELFSGASCGLEDTTTVPDIFPLSLTHSPLEAVQLCILAPCEYTSPHRITVEHRKAAIIGQYLRQKNGDMQYHHMVERIRNNGVGLPRHGRNGLALVSH